MSLLPDELRLKAGLAHSAQELVDPCSLPHQGIASWRPQIALDREREENVVHAPVAPDPPPPAHDATIFARSSALMSSS